jgi:putative addiction module component (TIGR02574 family)
MSPRHLSEIAKLSVTEQIQLVEDIWDMIAQRPDNVPLSPDQIAMLDERLDDLEANPGGGLSWPDVRARILRGE